MAKQSISGFLVDVKYPNKPYVGKGVWNRDADWRSIYELLNCTTFTIATRRFGNNVYDIYLDDEGLLKQDQIVTGVSTDMREMLVGNLFIVSHDDNGEVVGLTDDQIRHLHLFVISDVVRYSF
jgi:hypothetical protein